MIARPEGGRCCSTALVQAGLNVVADGSAKVVIDRDRPTFRLVGQIVALIGSS